MSPREQSFMNPVQLVDYHVWSLDFETVKDPESWEIGDESKSHFDVVSLEAQLTHDEDNLWLMRLSVAVNSEPTDKSTLYQITLELHGNLEWTGAKDSPPSEVEDTVKVTGVSLLYAAARHEIKRITEQGLYPSVILPVVVPEALVSFLERED